MNPYRVFTSEDGDWYVVGKFVDGKVVILYEGHHREQAYEEILRDLGLWVPIQERPMHAVGTYEPKIEDWND